MALSEMKRGKLEMMLDFGEMRIILPKAAAGEEQSEAALLEGEQGQCASCG